ncbi:MAG TPA: ABC transporter permease [Vicinamibacterales bacterium]|nr:ABC transporter permease [Vicinamibacterales bacterium]
MFDLIRDVRHAARRLLRTPAFTLATLVTLALGIGANTAIFSVVDSVLLKPLPFPEPDRLVGLWQTAPGVDIKDLNASIADYVTYREQSRTLADVAIWNGTALNVTGVAEPERVEGVVATFRLLPMLGVRPIFGRSFVERDDADGSPEVVMLGYGYWQRRFGGDPGAVGRRIMVDGTAREIIGVLPKDFWFMDMAHDLVVPLQFDRAKVHLAGYNFRAVGRLRPGVTLAQVDADVKRMIGIALTRLPPPEGMSIKMMEDARLGPNVRPLLEDLVGDIGKSLWVVMATIGMVLLIACANVANLLLVRTEGRSQELAVRAAIGAGRGRLAREMLIESLLLGLLGGAAGIGFAIGALKLVLAMNPAKLPRLELIAVDATSVMFTLVVSVAAGLAFGAIPVLKHARVRLNEALRAGGRNASSSRDRNITRNTLTIVQVALALVLLIGSGLMIRTFQSMRRVQPGFTQPAALQTLRIAIPEDVAKDDARVLLTQQGLVDALAALPGVASVSVISALPMTGMSSQDPVAASDHTYRENQIPPLRRFIRTMPKAFQVLGTPLTAGRDYDWTDIHQKRDVVLISDNFAREYWGSPAAAIGKRIRSNPTGPWSEVIGVVADIRHDGVDRPAPSTVYWPQRGNRSMAFVLRGPRAGTEGYAAEIRRAVASVSTSLPVTQLQTMQQVYDKSMARTAFTLTLLAISGGMALLLAAIGIYAVISYTVAQRTREIGIRMALGARQDRLKLMFVRNGLLWGGIGAAAGLVAAALLSQLMSAILFEINPIDPLTYGVVVVALLAAAGVASYVPARRVTRIDPVEALRAE